MKAITFLLHTTQPLLATSLQGDPNSDVSFPYIPGSMIRGVLIARYLQRHGFKSTKDYQLRYVLAHAEDGIIWGHFEVDSGILETSDKAFTEDNFPTLRLSTLQQCRIFGKAGEVLLWNSHGKWRSRLILQSQVSELLKQEKIGLIPESQILWGTQGKENGNFTLLSDGSQGFKYAAPITGMTFSQDKQYKQKQYRPVRLEVHHYFYYDQDGVARIFLSRLVSLTKEKIYES